MQHADTGRNGADDFDDDYEEDEDLMDDDSPMEDDPGDTVVLLDSDYSDNVGDISVEINVEDLVAKVEASGATDAKRRKEIRRRVEEYLERKNFEDTFSIDFDDDFD